MDGDVLEAALRLLRTRDLSALELDHRLELRGFSPSQRERAIETLVRTRLLDDRRFAEARAASLIERGAGNELVRYTLGRAGISAELVEDVLQVLPPEPERARVIALRRGNGPRTARYLAGKGFSEEVVAALFQE